MEFTLEKLREGMEVVGITGERKAWLESLWDEIKEWLPVKYAEVMSFWPEDRRVDMPSELDESHQNALFICLYCFLTEPSRALYLEKGYSLENWQDHMPDLLDHAHDENGEIWMDTLHGEFGWHLSILNGKNIKLGRLQFYPLLCQMDYPSVGLKKGDHLVGFHIPAGSPMTPESCLDSFARARKFFAERTPAWEFSHFYCASWLFNPIYQKYLPPTSNIVKVQKMGTIIPNKNDSRDAIRRVFSFGHEDVNTPTPRTSMQRAVQQILKNGEDIGYGIIVFPRDIK